ncbi:MAG TPA: carboxypeptidase-like regulatory domain-containing protein [Myxococcales bacterium]|jgi:hypothetical protein|nr:carboxypeptidase-like regulatory domain-containing protein [Myxococcales bacterium]
MDSKPELTQARSRGDLVTRKALAILVAAALLAGWLFFRTRAEPAARPQSVSIERGAVSAVPAAAPSKLRPRELPPSETAGYLAGKVLGADGRPAQGAEVAALGTEAVTASGADGSFAIDVPAGAQRLTARLGNESALMADAALVKAAGCASRETNSRSRDYRPARSR